MISMSYMLPMAMAWSISDGFATSYVLPILWMTLPIFSYNGAIASHHMCMQKW